LWTNAWAEMVPFLAFDVEIRRIVCTTNAIESMDARFRRAVNARGRFPIEQSALKVLYLTICILYPPAEAAPAGQPMESRTHRLRHCLRQPRHRRPLTTPNQTRRPS
jgi:hypothetical protein